jgi:hypothetical protein
VSICCPQHSIPPLLCYGTSPPPPRAARFQGREIASCNPQTSTFGVGTAGGAEFLGPHGLSVCVARRLVVLFVACRGHSGILALCVARLCIGVDMIVSSMWLPAAA